MGRRSRSKRERRELERQGTTTTPQQPEPQFIAKVEGAIFKGPLPHPEILEGYERILPGATDRIIGMAEANQNHRHLLEKSVIIPRAKMESRGQWFALIIALAVLGSGTFLVYLDKPVVGLSMIILDMATIVGLFLYHRHESKRELAKKDPRRF